ncbi:glycosyltransferase family A protein [Croceicoccus sp. F390]|uniref:Glycosyltransferase family A protein n=1 Tax=Croceicoccus esteveae TaxID=3075597 RepID=A0ABU2ZGG1_9SPHN|nr:glycosyltransferase family A protein [Croceicoccus sp. F390]MDT0575461.1 glycosyltransferase family A protein [Croceicoccus sp. F390]
MSDARNPKVGVIVPMYNSAATIGEALISICAQSWQNLDIVVVDDGSEDGSSEIVAEHARRDPRIRMIKQRNCGVAAARNRGAAETDADILSFIDADDLWAPNKIEAQLAVSTDEQGLPNLVYCWFARTDQHGRAYKVGEQEIVEGDVLRRICRENFVGSGSSLLMARQIFDRVGGFDVSLQAANAQGCEDLLFLAIAARFFSFRVVPRYLLGYRLSHTSMSSDAASMLRSFRMVAQKMLAVEPAYKAEWDAHHDAFVLWLMRRAVTGGRIADARSIMKNLGPHHSSANAAMLPELLSIYTKSVAIPRSVKSFAQRSRIQKKRARYLDLVW